MGRHILLQIAVATLFQALLPLAQIQDPIAEDGSHSYIMSENFSGDGYYLGCAGDGNLQCSMLTIDAAQTHDGWQVYSQPDGAIILVGWNGQYVLDLQGSAINMVDKNSTVDANYTAQWGLDSWSDGTYALSNKYAVGNLDVQDTITPFVNPTTTGTLEGQHWYFRQVEPQVTSITTVFTTSTVFQAQSSTETVTITTCLARRGNADSEGRFEKRVTGSGVLATTTNWSTFTTGTTVTVKSQGGVFTSTATVVSCSATPTTSSPTRVSTITSSASGSTTPSSTAGSKASAAFQNRASIGMVGFVIFCLVLAF